MNIEALEELRRRLNLQVDAMRKLAGDNPSDDEYEAFFETPTGVIYTDLIDIAGDLDQWIMDQLEDE